MTARWMPYTLFLLLFTHQVQAEIISLTAGATVIGAGLTGRLENITQSTQSALAHTSNSPIVRSSLIMCVVCRLYFDAGRLCFQFSYWRI